MRIRTAKFQAVLFASSVFVASLLLASPTVQAQTNFTSTTEWGTYYKLFAADSPWNARPVNAHLGTARINKPLFNPTWVPTIDDGSLSVGVFMAKAGDPQVTVFGKPGTSGVGDPDTGWQRNIVIPHWPAGVVPATGGDGHCDIVDTVTGVVHSFYQLKYQDGKWTANMYAWTRVDGRGWGDNAHWSQGSRSAGVTPSAGLIRLHEIDDGDTLYRHALAMSLPAHTLANGITTPSYVYPATTADSDAKVNTGNIPLGTRIMLPASFDLTKLSSERLRKVANTLKTYGAYAVDRNYDAPFAIYVENGSNYNLMPNGWDTKVVADLERIRDALRPVAYAESWLDGNGGKFDAPDLPGVLSMRGAWMAQPNETLAAGTAGRYDSTQQAVVFPFTSVKQNHVNYTSGASTVSWGRPYKWAAMKFTAKTTGGATLRLQVRVGNSIKYDSGYLPNGASASFTWPEANPAAVTMIWMAESGVNTVSSAQGIVKVQ